MATFDERKPTSSSGTVSVNMDATRANPDLPARMPRRRRHHARLRIASGSDITYNAAAAHRDGVQRAHRHRDGQRPRQRYALLLPRGPAPTTGPGS